MTGRVVLVPHDPCWAATFAAMRDAIMTACEPLVRDVLHIGSTAIPGIVAKPVIDMMPLLARHEDGEACIAPMTSLGFVHRGEYGIPGRRYFVRGEPRTHNGHMYPADHHMVGRQVRFRDYLIAHPDVAREYERLKHDLAARFGDDTVVYADAKSDFCERIDALTRAGGG